MKQKKVCIIGAGAAGLCAARKCVAVNKAGGADLEVEVFEQNEEVGGTWIYSEGPLEKQHPENTGNREWETHSSMYNKMITNLPKEVMVFEDLSFDDTHPGLNTSFISHEQVLAYLNEYSKPVKHLIKFNSKVVGVEPIKTSSTKLDVKWKVTVEQELATYSKMFDSLFVCNGHLFLPRLPQFASKYHLSAIHSHCYRKAEAFSQQIVCVVGAGPSGIDICLQIAEYAKQVFLCRRKSSSRHISFAQLPSNCFVVNSVVDAEPNCLILECGSILRQLDSVIYCTGYKYSFPFFFKAESSFRLVETPHDGCYVSPLFAHCVHQHHWDSLFFVGLNFKMLPFVAFERQVQLALAMMLHLIPEKRLSIHKIKQYESDRLKKLEENGLDSKYFHQLGNEQWEYFQWIYELTANIAGLPPVKPVPLYVQKIFEDVSKERKTNPQNYKNIRYKILDNDNFVQI